jgi:hypothetical protein
VVIRPHSNGALQLQLRKLSVIGSSEVELQSKIILSDCGVQDSSFQILKPPGVNWRDFRGSLFLAANSWSTKSRKLARKECRFSEFDNGLKVRGFTKNFGVHFR